MLCVLSHLLMTFQRYLIEVKTKDTLGKSKNQTIFYMCSTDTKISFSTNFWKWHIRYRWCLGVGERYWAGGHPAAYPALLWANVAIDMPIRDNQIPADPASVHQLAHLIAILHQSTRDVVGPDETGINFLDFLGTNPYSESIFLIRCSLTGITASEYPEYGTEYLIDAVEDVCLSVGSAACFALEDNFDKIMLGVAVRIAVTPSGSSLETISRYGCSLLFFFLYRGGNYSRSLYYKVSTQRQ